MRKHALLLIVFLFSAFYVSAQNDSTARNSLGAFDAGGKPLGAFTLKDTDVKVEISGFLARVNVTQEFVNDYLQPVDAVYVFPLSQNSAVDAMTMKIGERTIRGQIMKREEAREVYETAKAQGTTAALLDQERANIFTQSVANIKPNEKILIEISYVETLKFEDGEYEFVFPMVVAPRYNPDSVKPEDAARISPTRGGQDISIEVKLDAGVPIESIRSILHEIDTVNFSSKSAKINLKELETIPNKDFILRYDATGKEIQDALLTHREDKRGGFFTLVLSPPQNFAVRDITPKEIVFVLDTSGSMDGFPIEKAKEAMRLSLAGLHPNDRFNLITFAGDTDILFEKPVPATAENLRKAQEFLSSRNSGGGTEMMKAIKAAFAPGDSAHHLRIVCFMTDGHVGNEAEIISEVQKNPNARVFSFGIGNSVNRYLLDTIAFEGRGDVEYVSLEDNGEKAAGRFYERIRTPLLTDISIDWNNLPVEDVYPRKINDLFSAKPLILSGRYTQSAGGTIKLRGKAGGQVYEREINVNFPEVQNEHEVLATLWARRKIDELIMESVKYDKDEEEFYLDLKNKTRKAVTDLSIEYRVLSQYTAFVAVEDSIITQKGTTKRVGVPLQSTGNFSASSDPHGFGFQMSTGRRNYRSGSRSRSRGAVSGKMINQVANVVDLKLSATIDGQRVVLENTTQPETDLPVNSGNSSTVLKETLKRMEAHRKSLTSLRADIKMTDYDSQFNDREIFQGSAIYLPSKNQDSMVRIDWAKPRKEIFSLIKDKYVLYIPPLQQAFTGNTDGKTRDPFAFLNFPREIQNPLAFLNFSREKFKANFKIKYLGQEKLTDQTPVRHLEFTPKEGNLYKTVELWIDGNGLPVQVKLIEKNDNYSIIQLSNVRKNVQVNASEFTAILPKETKLVKN